MQKTKYIYNYILLIRGLYKQGTIKARMWNKINW